MRRLQHESRVTVRCVKTPDLLARTDEAELRVVHGHAHVKLVLRLKLSRLDVETSVVSMREQKEGCHPLRNQNLSFIARILSPSGT